jgi:hypothetical protein
LFVQPRPPSRQRPPPEALDLDFGGSVLPTNPGLSEMVIDGMKHIAREERRGSRGRHGFGRLSSSSSKRSSKKMVGTVYSEDEVADGLERDHVKSSEVNVTADDREIAELAVNAYERFQKKLFPARKYSSPDSRVVDEKYRQALMSSGDDRASRGGLVGRQSGRRDKDAILENILEHYQDLQSRIAHRSGTERKSLKQSKSSSKQRTATQKGRYSTRSKAKASKKIVVSGVSNPLRPKTVPSRVIGGEKPVRGTRQRRVAAAQHHRRRRDYDDELDREKDMVRRAKSPSIEPWDLQASRLHGHEGPGPALSHETRSEDFVVERMEVNEIVSENDDGDADARSVDMDV